MDVIFARLLDRVTAREMDMFTMHDRMHGLKVAHLMWHILKPERRAVLTPPEIGLLVGVAYYHDLGMALNNEERAKRLAPDADLWERLEIDQALRDDMDALKAQMKDESLGESQQTAARYKLEQAEEVLLCQDTRDRHATEERYKEVRQLLRDMHQKDGVRIPDLEAALVFDGDSFYDKLIEVCVSHRGDADILVQNDPNHLGQPRYPKEFPVGCANADLHMCGAALRLADTLDFDRERTPPVLFHYLLPGSLSPEHKSRIEWNKHLTISNWHIYPDAVVFKGRCNSHIIHHAVVLFCQSIGDELAATEATFKGEGPWPFKLPTRVNADIFAEGYTYVPYRFELDDDRVYSLLMGGAIYDNPLVAVRELIQNAVDACKLRDALTSLNEPAQPLTHDRIFIRYIEPTADSPQPQLIVEDTGTGMDEWLIGQYFLKVGRSFYNSSEFNEFRVQLRRRNLDFAPVSEFGIGFLSCFLLADRVQVETAMWEPVRKGDTRKRTLLIDGPTRLIKMHEEMNEGIKRFKGTRITLFLSKKALERTTHNRVGWAEIRDYVVAICQDLPYTLNLAYVSVGETQAELLERRPLKVVLPPYLDDIAVRIPFDFGEIGIEGETVLFSDAQLKLIDEDLKRKEPAIAVLDADKTSFRGLLESFPTSTLLRGGFRIGAVEGFLVPSRIFPRHPSLGNIELARIRLKWQGQVDRRFPKPNLARNATPSTWQIADAISQIQLIYLLVHLDDVPSDILLNQEGSRLRLVNEVELEEFTAYELYRLGCCVLGDRETLKKWETGSDIPLEFQSFMDVRASQLGWSLLDLVLPRVTSLEIRLRSTGSIRNTIVALLPPRPGWQTALQNCKDFITNHVGWGDFVEFYGEIDDIVWIGRGRGFLQRFFNKRWQEKFSQFDSDEVPEIKTLLDNLLEFSRTGRIRVTASQLALIKKVQEVIGDLEISDGVKRYRIDSFKVEWDLTPCPPSLIPRKLRSREGGTMGKGN